VRRIVGFRRTGLGQDKSTLYLFRLRFAGLTTLPCA
jgi:hypothetical protein